MGNHELLLKVEKLRELRAAAEELADQISAIEDDIKAEMTVREADRLNVGVYKVMWTPYTSRRLDSKALKAELPDIWNRYSVETAARRFSVN